MIGKKIPSKRWNFSNNDLNFNLAILNHYWFKDQTVDVEDIRPQFPCGEALPKEAVI